jgi:hypothetical protein
MPAIDYGLIREKIEAIINEDARLQGATVRIEPEIAPSSSQVPWVGIYMESRSAPDADQPAAAGRETVYQIRIMLEIGHYHMNIEEARRLRDVFLGQLELVMMENRTLRDTVDQMWLVGGSMMTGRREKSTGFWAAAELEIIAEARITTP